MSKRKYRDDAEGAVYPRIDTRLRDVTSNVTDMLEWLERRKARHNRDYVSEARAYCARVLSGLTGKVVEIRDGCPYDGESPLSMPWPGEESIDLARDVEQCLQLCDDVEGFRDVLATWRKTPSELDESLGPNYVKLSIDHAIELGLCVEKIRIRWAGFERAAEVGKRSIERPIVAGMAKASLKEQGKKTSHEQREAAERLYVEMLKQSPNASDKSLRARIAKEMGISVETLKRYLPATKAKALR